MLRVTWIILDFKTFSSRLVLIVSFYGKVVEIVNLV